MAGTLENLWVFSWRASATLRLEGTVLLRWDPFGLRQECDEHSLNCNRGQNLNQGFEPLPLRQGFFNASSV